MVGAHPSFLDKVICETYDSLVAAAVRPERDDCGDDLGGDARKFGDEYGGESRAVGAFIASVAAGSSPSAAMQ